MSSLSTAETPALSSDRPLLIKDLLNKEAGDEGLSSSFANRHHIEPKCHKLNALEVLEIARAKKNGKSLLNWQLEFNVSPLLKLAIYNNWN